MLGLHVTFLTGSIAAAGSHSGEVEWPPHPARLYAALAATFFEAGEDPAVRQALEWLEAQEPPCIWTSGSPAPPRVFEAYVPVNDVSGSPASIPALRGQYGGKQRKGFLSATLSDPHVIYGWQAEPPSGVLDQLSHLVPRVSYLGSSSSLVRLVLAPVPTTPPSWQPVDSGSTVLRVSFPGMLAALRESHARLLATGLRAPTPARPQPYVHRPAGDGAAPRTAATRGHFDSLWALRRTAGTAYPVLATVGLATALHRAVLARWTELCQKGDLPPLPEEVSGHDARGTPTQRPHVAFIGLPAVGHPRSDGHLLGLGVAVPGDLPPELRTALWKVLAGIKTLSLRPQPWDIELVGQTPRPDLPSGLQAWRWRGPARAWVSVTPVVLDRYPDELFGPEAEGIVREACTRAGLPEPESVVLRPTSMVPGAPPARHFPGYPARNGSPRVHALLVFPREVQGPVLVGRGRYRGLGLFSPLEDRSL